MSRRGHLCRCCADCNDCDTKPTTLIASVKYDAGSGVTVKPDVTTTCTLPLPQRYLERIKVTNPGSDYTSPPMAIVTGDSGTTNIKAVTIRGSLDSVAVVGGGSGYASAPAVSIANPGGGGLIRQAVAQAVVEGPVVGITLQSQGSGYSSPPSVVIAGGSGAQVSASMSGYVNEIRITSPGRGYTSPPSISISGGGGSGASAVATISKTTGELTGIAVTAPGSAYSTSPNVTISGGGGEDAQATASLLYRVQSLALLAGGQGYPPSPEVRIESQGGGGGAVATATISGAVVRIDVIDAGLYNVRSDNAGNLFSNWPSITIGGNASVLPAFSGGVHLVDFAGPPYETPPSVSFSGGGGTGATAEAELNWQQEHRRTAEFVNCYAVIDTPVFCFDVAPSPQSGCDSRSERIEWTAQAVSTNAERLDVVVGSGSSLSPETSRARFFDGEAIWAGTRIDWKVDEYQQVTATYFMKRFFSRVPPAVVYRLAIPPQEPADNCELTPTFRQYVDRKGDSFWYLESLGIADAGTNLLVPPGQSALRLYADGNSTHVIENPSLTFNRSPPVVVAEHIQDFSTQPQLSISVVPSGDQGFYVVDSVTVAGGGETSLGDGTILIALELQSGHFFSPQGSYLLSGVVTGGALQSVTIVFSDLIIGPATVASVSVPSDPNMNLPSRIVVGKSGFATSTSHQQPTVSASCEPGTEGGVAAALTPVLVSETDGNGRDVWRVQSVTVDQPGSGFQIQGIFPVVFEVASPGIEAFPAAGDALTARDEPTVSASIQSFGGGFGAILEAVIAERLTDEGDKYWEVTSVNVVNPGQGYSEFDGVVLEGGPGQTNQLGDASVAVDNIGRITGVTVTVPGRFWENTDRLHRVRMYSVGEYFQRTITETGQPLPPITCLGEVDEATGWEKNVQKFVTYNLHGIGSQLETGDDFTVFGLDRTRVCELPEIVLEFT